MSSPLTSPFAPRHLLSIADLKPSELTALVRNASLAKQAVKSGAMPTSIFNSLAGQTIAIYMSKRSTRTRVSCESSIAMCGGHPLFLNPGDIQLGVNESLRDTATIISSMVSALIARVGPHEDVAGLAQHSTVPVINGLSSLYHPLQNIADMLTLYENFSTHSQQHSTLSSLGLSGLKACWLGDASNVLIDLAIGSAKLGIDLTVATPKGYGIPADMRQIINEAGQDAPTAGKLMETNVPEEAIKNADVIFTDTWTSMGQEAEKEQRMRDFEGFQVTHALAEQAGAKPGWKFMHCLPRHSEEVDDDVFYSPRSLVFPTGENRKWSTLSVLEGFVINKGKII